MDNVNSLTANNHFISERMDRLPVSKIHYKILCLTGLGMFLDSFDIYLASSVLSSLLKSGWSTITLNAAFISASFIGLLIGALLTGFLGDKYGRKFVYRLDLLIFGGASLVAAISPNMTFLIACRGVIGIGLGAEIVTGYALLGEFVPAKVRGRWVSMLSLITNIAVPISALLGLIIIPTIGWRYMFVFVGVFSLIVWYMRKMLPESPRWYESKGRYEDAEKTVEMFEKSVEKSENIKLSPIDTSKVHQNKENVTATEGKFSDLFKGKMLSRTIVGCITLITINTLIYTFITWAPTLFLKSGINLSKSLGYTTIMMIGAPLGAIIGSFIVDRYGRKWCLVLSMILAGVIGYAYPLQRSMSIILILGFLLTILIYILVTVGLAVYVPEMFPTKIRLRGTGLANAAGRLATIFSPYGVAFLLTNYGSRPIFTCLGILLALTAFIIAVFGVETKQKPLEEI
ncbi:MAG: MFS transporter [Clostridiales bacterium]|nr:MFS transporter [Clostridiales bacterium]